MEWTDIRLTVAKADADNAEAVATMIAEGGIYIEDYSDIEQQVAEIAHVDLIEQELLDKPRDQVIIHLYLEPGASPVETLALIAARMEAAGIAYTVETEGVEQEDWQNGWRKYYHPIEIGQRLAVVPSWQEYDTDRVKLILDPGLAFGTGDDGDLRLFAVGGVDIGQQLPQRGTAALVAEEHEVVPFQTAADRAEVGQRQGHIRQDAPAALLGGLEGDAVVALVLLLLFLGGGHAVAAEEGDEMSAAQLDAVADDLFQLVLLGIACEEGHLHAGFGGAGVARLYAELYGLRAEAGDDGGVFDGFAAEEAEMAAQAGAKTVGLGPRILRCETAPLAVLSAVMTLTGNLE